MIDEINQIGNINNINDLLHFKFSVKTLVILGFLGGISFWIFIIILFGGVNNTIDYLFSILESTKNSISKNKNISNIRFNQNTSSHKQNEYNKKNNEDEEDEED